jgi:hypothetical protein
MLNLRSVGQSVLVSSSHLGSKTRFLLLSGCCEFVDVGAFSDERKGLSLQLLLAFASAVILGSEPRGTHDHILLPQVWDSLNLEGHFPVFISPRKWVAQLYPQALSSLFVSSYDSQGYGGGIRTRLHSNWSQSQSQSHIATDVSQSVTLGVPTELY